MRSTGNPTRTISLSLGSLAFPDTIGNTLAKPDTIRFRTKKTTDYGRVVLRFRNLDLSKNPLYNWYRAEEIRLSSPITSSEWKNDLIIPGEYEMRIVFDDNRNRPAGTLGIIKPATQPELANARTETGRTGRLGQWTGDRALIPLIKSIRFAFQQPPNT